MTGIWGVLDIFSLTISLLFIVGNYKRRTLQLFGSCFVGVTLISIALAAKYEENTLSAILLFCYIVVMNCTFCPLAWCIISEMTHNRLMNFPVASHWVFAFIIAQFFPIVVDPNAWGLVTVFLIFGVLTLFNGILSFKLLKESKGVSKA